MSGGRAGRKRESGSAGRVFYGCVELCGCFVRCYEEGEKGQVCWRRHVCLSCPCAVLRGGRVFPGVGGVWVWTVCIPWLS